MTFMRNVALATTMMLALGSSAMAAVITKTTKPVGTITIDETQVGFIVGGSGGGGVLHFGGKSYPFKVGGLSFGNVGISKIKASGDVYNMTKVSEFAGTYAKAEASATLGAGEGVLRLENDNHVVIELTTSSKGLQLSVGGGGVKITMKKAK